MKLVTNAIFGAYRHLSSTLYLVFALTMSSEMFRYLTSYYQIAFDLTVLVALYFLIFEIEKVSNAKKAKPKLPKITFDMSDDDDSEGTVSDDDIIKELENDMDNK